MIDLPPKLTVIICTYNNADSLAKTLGQLRACEVVNPAQVEIIVVDNNSSDETGRVLNSLDGFAFPILALQEPRQGLSHARNTGLAQAKGEYVLFTDDDADIPSSWISTYLETLEETEPDCLFSKIFVVWDKPKPWWFDNRFGPYFAQIDYGDATQEITNPWQEFFGKNFCIRASVLRELGGFDPKLGRCGTTLLAGEETIIFKRLIATGRRVIYTPDAPVGHRLKPREYSEANIKKQMVDMAVSSYFMAQAASRTKILGRPALVLRQSVFNLPRYLFRWLMSSLKGRRRDAFFFKLRMLSTAKLLATWIKNG